MASAPGSFSSAQCPVLKSSIDDIKPSLLTTYNVTEGANGTYVTGCDLLPDGDFAIAERYLPYVKYYNNQGVLKKRINTESCEPFDVCFIDNNTIAVSARFGTANYKHIIFVNTADNKVINKVHVGVGDKMLCFDKVLVVGNRFGSDSKIVVIDIKGDIVKTFKTTYIRGVFASNNMIYTAEWKNVVVCYDESGNIKWRYQDPGIKDTFGIVVDNREFIFVACFGSSSVVALSPDGQTSRTILTQGQGLDRPTALAIYSEDRKLMVCNRDNGKVFLYKL